MLFRVQVRATIQLPAVAGKRRASAAGYETSLVSTVRIETGPLIRAVPLATRPER